jgi:hypothetical protein
MLLPPCPAASIGNQPERCKTLGAISHELEFHPVKVLILFLRFFELM